MVLKSVDLNEINGIVLENSVFLYAKIKIDIFIGTSNSVLKTLRNKV